jgi:hypothetical protein
LIENHGQVWKEKSRPSLKGKSRPSFKKNYGQVWWKIMAKFDGKSRPGFKENYGQVWWKIMANFDRKSWPGLIGKITAKFEGKITAKFDGKLEFSFLFLPLARTSPIALHQMTIQNTFLFPIIIPTIHCWIQVKHFDLLLNIGNFTNSKNEFPAIFQHRIQSLVNKHGNRALRWLICPL